MMEYSEKSLVENLNRGRVLEGPFWPERVKVLSSKPIGANVEIQGIGMDSERFYSGIFSPTDLEKVKILETKEKDFSGDSEAFFLFMEGKRIRFAYQFDPLHAVNVSQIDPLPHQIDAVYFHILKNPRIRFLLADDPGAGKTIMAGLVLKELKLRGLVERILIVVPGHLKDQWVRELKEKFRETFKEINRATMNAVWGRNVWEDEKQVITSMDFAKQEEVLKSLAEVEWDLVIVDEAHKMAAYEYGSKKKETQRYELGKILSRHTKFLLFLTATPHRGDPENFRLFLDLLEPDFFATDEILNESIRNKDNPLFLRRLKEDLKGFDGTPLFPPRKVTTIKYRLSPDERRLYNAVTKYVEEYYNKALEKDKKNVAFALIILQRRLASSVRAVKKSLERRKDRLQALLEKSITREEEQIDVEALEDAPEEERWDKENKLLEKLTSAETLQELEEEIEELDELIKLAKEAEKQEIETKLAQLKKVIEDEKIGKGQEKLLIFTESKDTLEYLVEKIREWGYSVTYIHGGMNLDKRIEAEHEFKEKAQIMVSTEAGGEGINLQFCWLMVNYDIPWNPNRLEQRMGRIHRYGQQYEVHIYNLVATDTREGRILEKLFSKLETIKEQLGSDRVFDVIGDILAGKNLQELIVEAVTNKRSLDEILQEFDRITDEEAVARAKEASLQGLATRYIDFTPILKETTVAKENRLVPEYIEKFFLRAGEKLGLKVEKNGKGFYKIPRVPFDIRNLPSSFKTKFGEIFGGYNKLSFEKEKAFKGQAEFVAPGHPLLEGMIEKIFEKYKDEVEKGAVFVDPSGNLNGLIWFVETQIYDGTNAIVGKRIHTLYQDIKGNLRGIPPSILWDLKPSNAAEIPPEIRSLASDEDSLVAFTVEELLPAYLDEIRKQREHDASIKVKYGVRSLDYLIGQSEAKLIDYYTRRSKGENIPDMDVQNERKNREELERRKENLLKQIELEEHLRPSTPKIIGVAAVLPQLPEDASLREDKEVEEIGIRIAREYEISQGRNPEDVSTQNLGFDIRSKAPDGSVRYIEVKARAREGAIVLTPNEWLMAQRLGEQYWLYVVTNAATKPELYTIQDPASKLEPNEEVEIVRYIIKDWRSSAEKAEKL